MEEETIGLTKELIRIPSENPTGTEAAVAERVEAYLRGLGIEVERDPVVDGRENLIAEVGGPANAPALVFLNHMDTVPVGEGWTRDPFEADTCRPWRRQPPSCEAVRSCVTVTARACRNRALNAVYDEMMRIKQGGCLI